MYTVGGSSMNIEYFAQYIFSRISRSAVHVKKYDVTEQFQYYGANRINSQIHENLMVQSLRRLNA